MVKAIDKSMVISNIQLESKSGGKSGDFKRENKGIDLSKKKIRT